MRISDWSSDVCSSDLLNTADGSSAAGVVLGPELSASGLETLPVVLRLGGAVVGEATPAAAMGNPFTALGSIGRASCRARGCQYVVISVAAGSFKTKTTTIKSHSDTKKRHVDNN